MIFLQRVQCCLAFVPWSLVHFYFFSILHWQNSNCPLQSKVPNLQHGLLAFKGRWCFRIDRVQPIDQLVPKTRSFRCITERSLTKRAHNTFWLSWLNDIVISAFMTIIEICKAPQRIFVASCQLGLAKGYCGSLKLAIDQVVWRPIGICLSPGPGDSATAAKPRPWGSLAQKVAMNLDGFVSWWSWCFMWIMIACSFWDRSKSLAGLPTYLAAVDAWIKHRARPSALASHMATSRPASHS